MSARGHLVVTVEFAFDAPRVHGRSAPDDAAVPAHRQLSGLMLVIVIAGL